MGVARLLNYYWRLPYLRSSCTINSVSCGYRIGHMHTAVHVTGDLAEACARSARAGALKIAQWSAVGSATWRSLKILLRV